MISTAKVVSRALECGLLVKGAIAHGTLTADLKNSIVFGKPLIDAYLLQEEIKLASVILHHSFEQKILSFDHGVRLDGSGRCQRYLTPIERGFVTHMHLNWLQYSVLFLAKSDQEKLELVDKYIGILKGVHLTVSGGSRMYIDNTMKYLEECRRVAAAER